MATQRTIAQILVEIDNALKVGSPKLVKALHKDLLDTIAVSYLNRNDAADIALIGGLKNYDSARAGGYVAGEGFFIEAQLRQADVVISQGTTEAIAKTKSTQKTGLTDLTQFNVLPYYNGTSFPLAQLVIDENLIYKSLIANNTGNKPKDNPAKWAITNLSTGLFGAVHVNGFYKLGDVITNPADNLLYRLVTATPDPFESTNLTAEIGNGITGDWVVHHPVNENLTGTENNTIRLNALGNEEESAVIQNDGTDATINGILNVFGDVELNGGLIFTIADYVNAITQTGNNASYQYDSGDNGQWITSDNGIGALANIYVGDSEMSFGHSDTFFAISPNMTVGTPTVTPEEGFWMIGKGTGNPMVIFSGDNSVNPLRSTSVPYLQSLGLSSNNLTINGGFQRSVAIGGDDLIINESDSALMQRGIIKEHAKYLTDELLDLDFGIRTIASVGYVNNTVPPTKSGLVLAVTFANNPKKATVTFGTAFLDTNYSISIMGGDQRAFTVESKLAGSFIINTGSNTAPTQEVMWTAIKNGEFN